MQKLILGCLGHKYLFAYFIAHRYNIYITYAAGRNQKYLTYLWFIYSLWSQHRCQVLTSTAKSFLPINSDNIGTDDMPSVHNKNTILCWFCLPFEHSRPTRYVT